MPLLGRRDRKDPERTKLGFMFRDIVLETGPLSEAGLPEETQVFAIHVTPTDPQGS